MGIMFNVNHYVKIQLTDRGREILKEYSPYLHRTLKDKEDKDGWSKWQLWVVMEIWGGSMHNGCQIPFKTDIEIMGG
jgi:hypothetical protein